MADHSAPEPLTYAAAGVDTRAADEAVARIRALAAATHSSAVLEGVGTYGALVAPDLSATPDPVLVSGADGVGSKLKVASMAGRHDTVGIDCVAMCVNDIVCHGARPLFFLDYIGIGRLEPALIEDIVRGVAEGCRQAGCALVGGETAELPGMYAEGEYDLVGFAVGLVDRSRVIDGSASVAGDALIGIASSGLHSNGYSLARRIAFEAAGLGLTDLLPHTGRSVADELLEPTRIYAEAVQALLAAVPIHGLAHITSGGLPGRVPRALRSGLEARIEAGTWPVPAVFRFLAEAGPVEEAEMLRVFNMGIGMVAVLPSEAASEALLAIRATGLDAYRIGTVVPSAGPPLAHVLGKVLG